MNTAVERVMEELLSNTQVKEGLEFIQLDNEKTVAEQMEITSIAAPTFQEKARGEDYATRLIELGIKEVKVDQVGNVFGVRRGSGNGPTLVVCSHLDTVFPEGTDVTPKLKDGKIYAPGISDNGRGLAVVLNLVRALNNANIQTDGDIIFGATVGEEGLGDLRGVKALFQERNDIDGFISIEPGSPERTTYLATGSHRYKVTFHGPGGHSFGDFGKPSAIHALGRAIAKISELQAPTDPKTTFTVGMIEGGTSVNTIAEKATMLVDIRSVSQEALSSLEDQIVSAIHQSVADENKRWNTESIHVDLELVGDRPAGSQSSDATIVQTSLVATRGLGFEAILDSPSSTDSNVPISLGIPAVTLGGGGEFGGVHTLNEFFDPNDAYFGAQKIFLTMIGLVGIVGVSEALLPKR